MKKARVNSKSPGSITSVASGEGCAPPLINAVDLCPSEQAAPQPEQRPFTQTPSQMTPPGFTCSAKPGRERVSNKTNRHKNRLIIVASIQNDLIARLERRAEIAYTLRRLDEVEAVGRQLEEIHTPIASFWKGLAAQRQGAGDLDHAQRLLEQAVNYAPRNYQARALFILGSVAEYKGDHKAETELYHQALSLNTGDLFTTVESNRALAIQASIKGNQKQAISLLERILPLAHYYRARSSYLYLLTIHSLAIEYREAGRLQESLALSRHATTSSLASIYPEFEFTRAKTAQRIQERERASVVIVVPNPKAERRPQRKVTFSFQYVESRARRQRFIKPTIGRAPEFRSMVERVATVAPIHAPPFK